MNDPYSVLGLSSSASIEEVKKAYKRLAKKYHPDVAGNDENAARKMQEINAAYDAIINGHSYSDTSGSGPFGSSYSSYGSYSSGSAESNEMRAAASYINAHRFREALHVLSTVRTEDRNGRWYYYSSVAKYYSGDTSGALGDIAEAVKREPQNMEYSAFLERLRHGRSFYSERRTSYPSSDGFLSCCLPLFIMNLFCPGYFCIC